MAGTTEMDGLLRDLRDHVARFGGLQWMREHTDGADDLMAVAGEPLADHLERIRSAVREDVDARARAAWASWCAGFPWPRFVDGSPVVPGDVVVVGDPGALVVVDEVALTPAGPLVRGDRATSSAAVYRSPTAAELARALDEDLAGMTRDGAPLTLVRARSFARGILARLAEGGDDGGR